MAQLRRSDNIQFFEPSMNVLLFLMIKKFVYLEVLLILAGVKAALPTGAARHLSFVVIGICAARDRRAIRRTVFPNLSATMGGHCTIFDTDMGRYVHPIGSVLCFSKYDDAKTQAGDVY